MRTDSKAQKLDAFLQPTNTLSLVPYFTASLPTPVPFTANVGAAMNDGPEELLGSATNDTQTHGAHVQTEAPLR